jgi:hypothetical protein
VARLADEADADGLTDFYGLQAMAARAMFEAGECFIRFRSRRPEDGLQEARRGASPDREPMSVPLQLQMLSSEHLLSIVCRHYRQLRRDLAPQGAADPLWASRYRQDSLGSDWGALAPGAGPSRWTPGTARSVELQPSGPGQGVPIARRSGVRSNAD